MNVQYECCLLPLNLHYIPIVVWMNYSDLTATTLE